MEASGRTFVLVVVPDKTTMVPEYLPEHLPRQGLRRARHARSCGSRSISVAGAMDMRPRLAAAADRHDRPIYYPQDTHWTPRARSR